MKTKAENLRLFNEARELRENVRSGLHQKATNRSESKTVASNASSVYMHNKVNQHGPKKG